MKQKPPFDTLYLHIGLGKTGTTSIQLNLLEQADLLEKQHGLHFPRDLPTGTPFNGNHSMLLRALFSKSPRVRGRLSAIGLNSDQEIERFNQNNLEALERGFAASGASQALLSAESVGHFDEEDLKDLASWGRRIAREFKLVACIRNPVHALSSEIQQRLRVGARLSNLYANPPYYKFKSLFSELEKAFGRENIIAYSFHQAAGNKAGLAAALLEELGLDVSQGLTPDGPENTRMSQEATLLLNAFNEQVPAFINGKKNPARRGDEVQRLNRVPGRPYQAPAEVLESVREISMDDTLWLADNYGVDLRCDLPEPARSDREFTDDALNSLALLVAGHSTAD